MVAVAFQPLREALQRGVNRLTYGAWHEPHALVRALHSRLEQATGPERALADVLAAGRDDLRLRFLAVRTPDGEVLASVPLTGDRFAVGYRNSVYTTLAEERYRVLPDGRFALTELAADQVAVLEEYYAVPGAPRPAPSRDRRAHVAEPDPARPAVFDVLNIAATDLGERTLYVPGAEPVPIWRLVTGEDPTVLLEIEP